MAKLLIRIKANLLVNEFIAKLLDHKFRNIITILRFKNYDYIITRCLLMDVESVSKLIASSNKRFFGINCHINDNLKFIIFKFCNRKFQFSHSHSNIYVPSAPPKDDYLRRSVALIYHFSNGGRRNCLELRRSNQSTLYARTDTPSLQFIGSFLRFH